LSTKDGRLCKAGFCGAAFSGEALMDDVDGSTAIAAKVT
jgi:hypothetical protein